MRALRTSDFDFALPPELIAQHPAARRDASRLLVLDRVTGGVQHRTFSDLVEMIPPGDALVLNDTRVFPARLAARRPGGGDAEVLLLHPQDGSDTVWTALVRPGNKLRPGRLLEVAPELRVEILERTADGNRIVRLHTSLPIADALDRFGAIPLPPYVDRAAGPEDRERYQTVYARERGSVAAPTAGLHFTPGLLQSVQARGVEIVSLVLHVGVGTFRPVATEDPSAHPMHAEHFRVSTEAAASLNAVRSSVGKIWAVGTTVVRTLETVADPGGVIQAAEGWTDIFIRPPYQFRAVDHLLTNFHLPRSTLLMLVSAFGGYPEVTGAYREAIASGYRFYSYGDAMLLL
ncbi:MAG: tRNA preQ1(34) S-adenosylmethionine ribosyltransferase-isomerase QueA [Gemmatimonadota bacterium]|nr:tRNA preQ1(34) S-adenosylmethionine ribosyltransferase-isomerase QueA [Gemmatimonadota bacterium]